MITKRVKFQVMAFLVIAALGISYVSAEYVGLGRLVGQGDYSVQVALPESGGIFENAEVTYRGVPVGRVGELTLVDEGILVDLDLAEDGPQIPADLTLVVANRSAIGEQYVDLRPTSNGAPYLEDGAEITATADALPVKVEAFLGNAIALTDSLPREDLRRTVDELYDASRGASDDLRALIDASDSLVDVAEENFNVTAGLIDSAPTVLATQHRSADNIASFSRDLQLMAESLEANDRSLRALIAASPDMAREVESLIDQVGAPLGVLLGNLLTANDIFSAHSAGFEDVLIRAPEAVSAARDVLGPNGLQLGLITSFTNPLPCTTGYSGTNMRQGTDTGKGRLNINAGCTANMVRGPARAPRGQMRVVANDTVTVPSTLAELMGQQ